MTTSYDDWYPSNFFKADDLVNGPLTLTIADIHPEKMQDGNAKPVVFFREDRRGLVLNKTNKNSLVFMTKSKNPTDAAGLRVMLIAVPGTFQGKPCMGIRIQPATAAEPPKPATSNTGPTNPSKPAPAKRGRPSGKKSAGDEMDDGISY